MTKVNDLLAGRFKKGAKQPSKMTDLAELSTSGKLSSFAGVFRVAKLSASEEKQLKTILDNHAREDSDTSEDLKFLSAITSEVKAINNQGAILHGQRIKQVQEVLKTYRDGAFSAWLKAAYGNRQTPYNFLQYYEFYSQMPRELQQKVDMMPRQAIYSLATRACDAREKTKIVESYKGESKQELLALIRERFPLAEKDKRAPNRYRGVLSSITQLKSQIAHPSFRPSPRQRKELKAALLELIEEL